MDTYSDKESEVENVEKLKKPKVATKYPDKAQLLLTSAIKE